MRYSISIVDDEETIRDGLDITLSPDYDISLFEDAESFIDSLEQSQPDLLLLDIGLPGMSGIQALHLIKEQFVHLPVIMITAFEDISMVIESMKTGAFDFILKPMNPDLLEVTIEKAISSIAIRKEVQLLQEKYLRDNLPCFIGESENIEDIMEFVQMVAKSPDTPIMVTGETGTGKELIAKAIHARSPVFQGPFVAVNCSAFPDELIESELFGYEPGAFSGAKSRGKKGLIEMAANGTLFLDEVADLSSAGQAKLLRFLESGEFYKVGGTQVNRSKVRIVSATNKDIESMVADSQFRKDLFFRLCVVRAELPSLNDRRADILPLSKYFVCLFNEKFDKQITGISTNAQTVLLEHTFTGNIRELKNILERACLIAQGSSITSLDLGLTQHQPSLAPGHSKHSSADDIEIPDQGIDLSNMLADIEHRYMEQALALCNKNETQAAKLLKMNHHTFRYKRKKFKSK